MRRILVIGASSAIAQHCIRIWADRGEALFLVARNYECLQIITHDAIVRGAAKVDFYCADLNEIEEHPKLLEAANVALGHIDIVLIAHGTLSKQEDCQLSVDATLTEIRTNALSAISFLTYLANDFEARRAGIIAVISSVAGDRGRASNYVYGSAKAMISEFTSGLRQRLFRSNVTVTTIKPGFVDTPMTAKFQKGLLWAKPASVARAIVIAIDKKKDVVYVPAFWWGVMMLIKTLPTAIFKKIKL